MAYALIDPQEKIVEESKDPPPPGKVKTGWRWVPIVVSTTGSGDHSTYTETILPDKVTRVTAYRPYTPAELEAQKDQLVDDAEQFELLNKAQFRIINEIRILQAKPELTPAQYKQWLRSLL
jgi:hypothetical protein